MKTFFQEERNDESTTTYFITVFTLATFSYLNYQVFMVSGLPPFNPDEGCLEYHLKVPHLGISLANMFILVSVLLSVTCVLNMFILSKDSYFRWFQRVSIFILSIFCVGFSSLGKYFEAYHVEASKAMLQWHIEDRDADWADQERKDYHQGYIDKLEDRLRRMKIQNK